MTMLALLVPRAAEAAPGGLAECALAGRAADRGTLERLMAGQVRRYDAGPVARRTYAAGLAAYVYGLPPVMLHRTVETFPRNALVAIAKLADETTDSIVAPNHDTLYSVGWIDLSAGPLVLETPPTAGRYAVVQLLDRPDEVLGRQLADLMAGDEVDVLDTSGPYWQVICPDGLQGWVHRTTLGAAPESRWQGRASEPAEANDLLTAVLSARRIQ
jgi:hypothetical protein